MRMFTVKKWHIGVAVLAVAVCGATQQQTHASTFGAGVFGANVPFGSLTTISIALSNDVAINAIASGGSLKGTGSHGVTVTSTDVVGYDLYLKATSATSMNNGASSIAASGNTVAAPLVLNTWGYNTSGSTTDFIGITGSQALIRSGVGPFKDGVVTTVSYGTMIDMNKSSGDYSTSVTYTAVGRN